jgi:hypothetical protein
VRYHRDAFQEFRAFALGPGERVAPLPGCCLGGSVGIKANPTDAELMAFGRALWEIIQKERPRDVVLVNDKSGARMTYRVSAVRISVTPPSESH